MTDNDLRNELALTVWGCLVAAAAEEHDHSLIAHAAADGLLPVIARHVAQARANELEQAAEWLDTWPEDGGPAQNHCPETVDAIHGAGWAIVELRTYAAIIRRTLDNPNPTRTAGSSTTQATASSPPTPSTRH